MSKDRKADGQLFRVSLRSLLHFAAFALKSVQVARRATSIIAASNICQTRVFAGALAIAAVLMLVLFFVWVVGGGRRETSSHDDQPP